LENFDRDAALLQTNLTRQICLPAETLMNLRDQYATNMFERPSTLLSPASSRPSTPSDDERFFDQYRHFTELQRLRQTWPFLHAALTTVYFPAKRAFSLNQLITFLEYRQVCQ
jgi:hypothetical protein